MNKLINEIQKERILEELNYILKETVNIFIYDEKYKISILEEFKKEIDLIARLIGERTYILSVINQNIVRVLNSFEDDLDNFDCKIFVNGELTTLNITKNTKANNIYIIMTSEEFNLLEKE